MTSQQDRMNTLRRLYKEMHEFQIRYDELHTKTKLAKVALDQAKTRFRSYQDDLIGDLFNGCFGQEWLLEELR